MQRMSDNLFGSGSTGCILLARKYGRRVLPLHIHVHDNETDVSSGTVAKASS